MKSHHLLNTSSPLRTSNPWRLAGGALLALAALLMLVEPAFAAEPDAAPGEASASATPRRAAARTPTRTRTRTPTRVRKRRTASRRDGLYLSSGLGLVNMTDQPASLDLDDGTGISIGLGYRLTPDLAIEGAFMASLHDTFGQDASSGNAMTGGSLNLKYFFPLSGNRLEAYGQAGIGFMSLETDNAQIDGTMLDLGGGIDYRISKETALGAKANFSFINGEDSTGDAADINTFTIMATLSFQLEN